MLEYINLLLIVLIIGVLIFDSIYLKRAHDDIIALKSAVVRDNSLVDLSEFKKLDPKFKQHYKHYIVDELMPGVIGKVNKTITDEKINDYLSSNKPAIDRQINDFVQSL